MGVPLLFIVYPIPKIVLGTVFRQVKHCLEVRQMETLKRQQLIALEMERRRQREAENGMNEVEKKQKELERLEALLMEMEKEDALEAERQMQMQEKQIPPQEELVPNAPMEEESDDHETSIEASQEIAKPEKPKEEEAEKKDADADEEKEKE